MNSTIAIDPLAVATAVVAVVDPQLRRSVTDALAKTSTQLVDDVWSSGDLDELIASIERLRPSVLFLGLPGLLEDASSAVARIANLPFAPRIVAVSGNANPDIILKTMRAGAAEFLYPPFEGFEAVLRSVATAARSQMDAPAAGKVIAFASVKGGCGATTLACHAAGWFRTAGKKEVLLADLDTTAGIASSLMQGDREIYARRRIAEPASHGSQALESAGDILAFRRGCDSGAGGTGGRAPDLPQVAPHAALLAHPI